MKNINKIIFLFIIISCVLFPISITNAIPWDPDDPWFLYSFEKPELVYNTATTIQLKYEEGEKYVCLYMQELKIAGISETGLFTGLMPRTIYWFTRGDKMIAPVRFLMNSWWESSMVRFSQPPLSSSLERKR